jgi:hypothetical protein
MAAPTARRLRVGCFPGSFDPPTVAHLAVAEAARAQADLDRVDLVISRWTLGKEHLDPASVGRRLAVLERVCATRPWLRAVVTEGRLIAEVAAGYDAVVLGADKWRQVIDPAWYGDDPSSPAAIDARDAAVAALPRVLVAPRAGDRPQGVELLHTDDAHHHVSSSAVRAGTEGAHRWVLPEAADHPDWQRGHQ